MQRYYGDEGLRAATEFVNSARSTSTYMTEHYPLTPLALENCLAVLVHTQEAFEQVEAMKQWPVASRLCRAHFRFTTMATITGTCRRSTLSSDHVWLHGP